MALKGTKILLGKVGLDGHDAGVKVVALALRDAGAEVIYTGLRKSPEFVARTAVDEDVDAVGLSLLSGAHMELVSQTIAQLAQVGRPDMKVFVGGTIPKPDRQALLDMGVRGVFTAGMKIADVLDCIDREL